jgi:hypothetical protein
MNVTYWINRNGRTHIHIPGVTHKGVTFGPGLPESGRRESNPYNPKFPHALCSLSLWHGATEVDSLEAGVPCKVCVKKLAKLQEDAA